MITKQIEVNGTSFHLVLTDQIINQVNNLKNLYLTTYEDPESFEQVSSQISSTIVKRFNALDDWKAFRLGSPSVALPDVLVVSSKNSTIFTIEAKSGTGNTLQVPFDQIIRCLNWTNTFGLYETRKVILAFKFLSKKRVGVGKYESRELREFFKVWDETKNAIDCVCTYEGKTYAIQSRKRVKLNLNDYKMPFFKP